MQDFEQDLSEQLKPGLAPRKSERTATDRDLATASAAGNRAVQRLFDSGGSTSKRMSGDTIQRKIDQKRGTGESLSRQARANTEHALNQDFSGVRIHRDSEADDLSRALRAKAFTTGDDIFFKSGSYDPDSSSGQKLLAHELTHVFQQRQAGSVTAKVSEPTDASEIQAHHVADTITSGSAVEVQRLSAEAPAGISLDDDEDELDQEPTDTEEEEDEDTE
jgi:hypothetical protein